MAHARGGVVLALVCLGGIAWAGAPCEEGREQTGIAMAMIGGGLAVAVVDADSVAAASGVAGCDEPQRPGANGSGKAWLAGSPLRCRAAHGRPEARIPCRRGKMPLETRV